MNKSPLFLFNGVAMPLDIEKGYLEESEQLVEGGRNARAQVIAQPINRRLKKFSNLVVPFATDEQVKWLEDNVANFETLLTYYDSKDGVVTRRFYFGDMTATPEEWDFSYTPVAKPTLYKDVKVNIIDMGY